MSASIRTVAAASTESGSSPSPLRAACTRSRSSCGFPPERSTISSRTCSGSGASSVTSCANARAASGDSGVRSSRSIVSAGGGEKPSPSGRRSARIEPRPVVPVVGRDRGQQVRRRLVHQLGVLEREQRALGHDCAQEVDHGLVQARATEVVAEGVDLRRALHRGVGGRGHERQPRDQRRIVGGGQLAEAAGHHLGGVLPLGADQLAEHVAEGDVRRRRREGLPRRAREPEVLAPLEDLIEEPGLPEPRLGLQHDGAPAIAPRVVHRGPEHAHLVDPAGEGELLGGRVLRAAERDAHGPRLHRLGLALDHEGLELDRLEPGGGPVEHRARSRRSSPRVGLRHQPRGQVHGVAHHGVGPPVLRTDVAGEHRAVVDPDAHGESRVRRRRSCGGRGAAAPRRHRSARGAPAARISLPPSASTSEARKHTSELVDRLLGVADEPVELGRRPQSGPSRSISSSVPSKWMNADADLAVLRLGGARQQRLARGDRHAGAQELVGDVGRAPSTRPRRVADGAVRSEEAAGPVGVARGRGRQRRRGGRADRRSRRRSAVALHRDHLRRRRTRDDQLAVRPADQEEVEPCRCGHRRTSAVSRCPPGVSELADLAEPSPHPVRRPGRAPGMFSGSPPSNHRSSASPPNFSRLPSPSYARTRSSAETGVDRVGHLLGADPTEPGELLREGGEPGDVDEDHRPVGRAVTPASGSSSSHCSVSRGRYGCRWARIGEVAITGRWRSYGWGDLHGSPRGRPR